VDRGEAGVAGGDADVAVSLEMVEEGADVPGIEVVEVERAGGHAGGVVQVAEQEPQAVPVGGDGVGAGSALG